MDEIDKLSTGNSNNSYQNMNIKNKNKQSYKPQTLDDYKAVSSAMTKHVPKSLGANVGSDEWLDIKSRQIKAKEFSNQIKETNSNVMQNSSALALLPKNELSLRSNHSNGQNSNINNISRDKDKGDSNGQLAYKKRFNYQQDIQARVNNKPKKVDNIADDLRMLNDLENM